LDPIKIVIFVAAFLLLLLLGRKLSAMGESRVSMLPPEEDRPETAVANEEATGRKNPVFVGADLPFPINLPEIEQDADGRYNRPEFLNYYFGKINIQSGPENPEAFCDEFFLQARDPENQHIFTYRYTVATPAGLQRAMDLERLPSLYLGTQVVIVPRWDVRLILETVIEQILELYGEKDPDEKEIALPNED
jgi:hypothetical protein